MDPDLHGRMEASDWIFFLRSHADDGRPLAVEMLDACLEDARTVRNVPVKVVDLSRLVESPEVIAHRDRVGFAVVMEDAAQGSDRVLRFLCAVARNAEHAKTEYRGEYDHGKKDQSSHGASLLKRSCA